MCLIYGIEIVPHHIPGIENTTPDWLSRYTLPPQYRASPTLLESLRRLVGFDWQPHAIDLFARRESALTHEYCSLLWDSPRSWGNAFNRSWRRLSEDHFLLIHPCPKIMGLVMAKLHNDLYSPRVSLPTGFKGLAIITTWAPSTPWFRPLKQWAQELGATSRVFKGTKREWFLWEDGSLPTPRSQFPIWVLVILPTLPCHARRDRKRSRSDYTPDDG